MLLNKVHILLNAIGHIFCEVVPVISKVVRWVWFDSSQLISEENPWNRIDLTWHNFQTAWTIWARLFAIRFGPLCIFGVTLINFNLGSKEIWKVSFIFCDFLTNYINCDNKHVPFSSFCKFKKIRVFFTNWKVSVVDNGKINSIDFYFAKASQKSN